MPSFAITALMIQTVSFAMLRALNEGRRVQAWGGRVAVLDATKLSSVGLATFVSELAELKRRDTAAWTRLFESEHPLVYRAVLAQVADRAVAEDIAAQVFLEALEGIERYRDRSIPIRAWLLTIARNRSVDWFRKRKRELSAQPDRPTIAPSDYLFEAFEAMSRLTPEQREVVHLRFIEGYQLEEVGRLMHRSTGAVKALQHRALERLRGLLSETPREVMT